MWVHEGFTNYSETLFTEYHFGKSDAEKYVQGLRKGIANDIPIIGVYGVNQEGSGDMYHKGANMLHTIRQVINDDKKFRAILRGLNKTFYHQTVTTQQVEQYMIKESGKDLQKIFDQYLRTTNIPVLKLDADKEGLKYKWENTVPGFSMPIKLSNGLWITPSSQWKTAKMDRKMAQLLTADPNFYIVVKKDD
jgi:aminopeptidase N